MNQMLSPSLRAPDRIRTCDLRLCKPALFLTELQGRHLVGAWNAVAQRIMLCKYCSNGETYFCTSLSAPSDELFLEPHTEFTICRTSAQHRGNRHDPRDCFLHLFDLFEVAPLLPDWIIGQRGKVVSAK